LKLKINSNLQLPNFGEAYTTNSLCADKLVLQRLYLLNQLRMDTNFLASPG